MTGRDPDAGLSIPDLLSTATSLLERVDGPLLPRPQGLSVRYLRRKPGRGLAVIYDVNSPRPHELSAMLGAIAACLAGEERRY